MAFLYFYGCIFPVCCCSRYVGQLWETSFSLPVHLRIFIMSIVHPDSAVWFKAVSCASSTAIGNSVSIAIFTLQDSIFWALIDLPIRCYFHNGGVVSFFLTSSSGYSRTLSLESIVIVSHDRRSWGCSLMTSRMSRVTQLIYKAVHQLPTGTEYFIKVPYDSFREKTVLTVLRKHSWLFYTNNLIWSEKAILTVLQTSPDCLKYPERDSRTALSLELSGLFWTE